MATDAFGPQVSAGVLMGRRRRRSRPSGLVPAITGRRQNTAVKIVSHQSGNEIGAQRNPHSDSAFMDALFSAAFCTPRKNLYQSGCFTAKLDWFIPLIKPPSYEKNVHGRAKADARRSQQVAWNWGGSAYCLQTSSF
ncbi:hypothetical protein HF259_23225 [Rhizobium leguminosarum]|uniref:hypothetical protein n=1 Tax=Rhizobium leguminosarum TaxID=384 RepID=UPI001C92B58B|nr:hypothetical protein [Rhizobium leguminosarum]MBY2924314.1 hypothetical protein [Rhizobium leguminosarum]